MQELQNRIFKLMNENHDNCEYAVKAFALGQIWAKVLNHESVIWIIQSCGILTKEILEELLLELDVKYESITLEKHLETTGSTNQEETEMIEVTVFNVSLK